MLAIPRWLTQIHHHAILHNQFVNTLTRTMATVRSAENYTSIFKESCPKKSVKKYFRPQKFITQFPTLHPGERGRSVLDFPFSEKRVRLLSTQREMHHGSGGVVYWMSRDQRVQDNWALLYAQKIALEKEIPLHVCFCLVSKFLDATIRHYSFMLKGLEEVEQECRKMDIAFHLLAGHANEKLPEFVLEHQIGVVVTDFSPLRTSVTWVQKVKANLPETVPLFQVDAHNIVPCWEASAEQERSASTMRKKLHAKLPEYCTEFPPVIKHPYPPKSSPEAVSWTEAQANLQVDRTVGEVDWATPGTRAGLALLSDFISDRLESYAYFRNDPTENAQSNISPWLHFGQVSAQRVVLALHEQRPVLKDSVEWILEQLAIRRELSDNYCFHNPNYDRVDGTHEWAQQTLHDHSGDQREHVYRREQLENAQTHDDLWNACQKQLMFEGKLHGYLRMFWAKKILEWTSSPETALADCIYLNDRYSLDGRDPNGYSCIMWSVCGLHDREFPERPVYGKLRYMGYTGFMNNFDISTYIRRYISEANKPGTPQTS